MLKNIKKILISRKLAIVLLTVITVLLIIGSLLPKITYLSDSEKEALRNSHPIKYKMASYLTPPELSKRPLFIGLNTALFIIILSCTGTRMFYIGKKQPTRPSINGRFDCEKEINIKNLDKILELINSLQGIKGWQKSVERDNLFSSVTYRQKNYRLLGSIIFHVSLLLIILGGFISSIYGLNAGIVLAEGQTVPLNKDYLVEVIRVPNKFVSSTPFEVGLAGVNPILNEKGNELLQFKAKINIVSFDGRQNIQEIKINQPAKYNGYRLAIEKYGPAPAFEIKNKITGQVVYDAFFNLEAGPEKHDSISLPDSDHVMVRYFADFYRQGNKIGTKSIQANNPVFLLYTGNQKGLLQKGQSITINNWVIKYSEFRQWAFFRVTHDPGEIWIYLGSGLAILGLLLRFSRDERIIIFSISRTDQGHQIKLNGTSLYFPSLFEDNLQKLLAEINLKISEVSKYEQD